MSEHGILSNTTYALNTPRVIFKPAASVSPRCLLEMQNLRSLAILLRQNLHLTSSLGALKIEKL